MTDDDCGAIGGTTGWWRESSTGIKSARVLLWHHRFSRLAPVSNPRRRSGEQVPNSLGYATLYLGHTPLELQLEHLLSIISETGGTIWSKRNVGSSGHYQLPSSLLLGECIAPSAPAIF
jgi:hypothetical protein